MSFGSDRRGYRGVNLDAEVVSRILQQQDAFAVALIHSFASHWPTSALKTSKYSNRFEPFKNTPTSARTCAGGPFELYVAHEKLRRSLFPQRQQLLPLPPFPDLAQSTARNCCRTRRAVKCSAARTDGRRAVTAVWPPLHHMFSWLSAICFFNTCTLFRRDRLQNGIQTTPADERGARIYSASHFRRPPRFAHNIIYYYSDSRTHGTTISNDIILKCTLQYRVSLGTLYLSVTGCCTQYPVRKSVCQRFDGPMVCGFMCRKQYSK